jgi:hypothetical protein
MPPPVAPIALASAFIFSPLSFASTRTSPVAPSSADGSTIASTFAVSVTSAKAIAPLRPTTERLKTTVVAVATFSPIAWTVIDEAPVMSAPARARVRPETMAKGSRIVIARPPPPPPGAVASAVLIASALIVALPAPVIVSAPVAVVSASVLRPLFALATVTPAAKAPVATLTVLVRTVWTPVAVTVRPPAPIVPWAPEEAVRPPVRLTRATAPLRPRPTPPPTAIASVSASIVSVPTTLSLPTGPKPAPTPESWTLPTRAVALPVTLTTATAAPTAPAPRPTPIA